MIVAEIINPTIRRGLTRNFILSNHNIIIHFNEFGFSICYYHNPLEKIIRKEFDFSEEIMRQPCRELASFIIPEEIIKLNEDIRYSN